MLPKLGETCEHGIHLFLSVPFCCMLIIILFKKGERGGSSSLVQMLSLERKDHLQGGLAPFCWDAREIKLSIPYLPRY